MLLHPEGVVDRLLECFKMLGPFFCLCRVLSKDFRGLLHYLKRHCILNIGIAGLGFHDVGEIALVHPVGIRLRTMVKAGSLPLKEAGIRVIVYMEVLFQCIFGHIIDFFQEFRIPCGKIGLPCSHS